jgi:hypothetical protein
VIGLCLHQSVFAKKKKKKEEQKILIMFLACFKISESFSLPVSCRQIQTYSSFCSQFSAQDVNDVSALPSYGDIDQFLELYYFACF